MKKIEDAFQKLISLVLYGPLVSIEGNNGQIVDEFFALWDLRSKYRTVPKEEIELKGLRGGGGLTKDQEEIVEKKHGGFIRTDGKIPARQVNGFQIQMLINRLRRAPLSNSRWGILRAVEGELIVPDAPAKMFVPISPNICLLPSAPCGLIAINDVATLNRNSIAGSQNYYFARDLSVCPL